MRRFLLRSWLWKPRIEDEVDGELAFHLEMRTREYVAQGLSPDEARRAAVARFGDVERAQTLCRDLGIRRDRTMNRRQYLSELRQDLAFAVRQLVKNPGFAIVATLTLALGIGGTAAIFSVVNAVVLKPLPVREPQQLVRLWETFRQWHTNVTSGSLEAWRTRGGEVFESIAGSTPSGFNLADDGGVERVISARVTADYFRVFGVEPMLGRTLGPADDEPGKGQVAVLSEQLWRRRFGADAGIVGRDVRLNGRPYRIVGVMPASFRLTTQAEELWVPTAFTPAERASFARRFLIVFGRLKPGVTREQAQARTAIIAEQLKKERPDENADRGAVVNLFIDDLLGGARQQLLVLLGAVGFVLLIGCANVANLLLARGTSRASELAVRAALGAGRGRVIRQLLTENAVLAGLGAAAGLALAVIVVRALVLFAPDDVPRLDQAHLDSMTLSVTAFIAIASSLLFGLAPVRRAMSQHTGDVLKGGGRSGDLGMARDRVRQVLVVVEVALALVLLAGAGLLIRTAVALQQVDLGFDPSAVLSARVSLPMDGYEDPLKVRQTFERIAEQARAVPGAQSAELITRAPLGDTGNWIPLQREGEPVTVSSAVNAQLRVITPGYLQAMRIPVQGRAFTSEDREGAPKVIIVSETLARQLWPGGNAIGKRVDCCGSGDQPEWKTIVGVAKDVRGGGPARQSEPEYYLPLQQAPPGAWVWNQRTMSLVARASTDPVGMTASMREAVTKVDPTLPLFDVQTMNQRLSASLATAHFVTGLLTTLGAIGLLLAAIGIYGVMAYSVSQRTQEIGVRLALGAAPRDVLLLVTRQAIKPILIGVSAGFILAYVAASLLEKQLTGVTAHDPATFALVTIMLVIVAIIASLVPARRAAHVDPTRALSAS